MLGIRLTVALLAACQWPGRRARTGPGLLRQLELEFHRRRAAVTGVTGGSLPGSATALLTDFIKFVAASNFLIFFFRFTEPGLPKP